MSSLRTASGLNAAGAAARASAATPAVVAAARPWPPARLLRPGCAQPVRRQHRGRLNVAAEAIERTASVQQPAAAASKAEEGDRVKGIMSLAGGVGLLALGAAAGGIWIDSFSTPLCQTTPEGCEAIPLFMKVPLVATHLFTFGLVPATMYVFYTRSQALKSAGAQDPFTAMVGLAFIMVAIAGEIGWHVTQEWFYAEDYSILNFFFYFFLILGTALWAIGIKEDDTTTSADEKVDAFLLASPVLAGLFYLLGASVLHAKLPIYLLLAAEYTVLTWRFWKLLDTPKVLLFPLFSVGVNLTFIALLNKHQTDPILNPLFHILHDAAGTELGVAIIASLVYLSLPANAEPPRLK